MTSKKREPTFSYSLAAATHTMENSHESRLQDLSTITEHKLQTCTGLALGSKLHVIEGKMVVRRSLDAPSPGKSASVKLYSSTLIDPETRKGKLSKKAKLKKGKKTEHNGVGTKTYQVKFYVEPGFGLPGAFAIKNRSKHEFYLVFASIEIHEGKTIHFECNSWVYPFANTLTDRVFFSNTSYLPNKTPEALVELRKAELISLRGDGTGERQEWDRIYDYDLYNDLGDPDKAPEFARQVLGASQTYPYPRRGRTGRPPTTLDPATESIPAEANLNIYVPPDERFSPQKLSEFISNSVRSLVHFLIPEVKALTQGNSGNFESFHEIKEMFSSNRDQSLEEWLVETLNYLLPNEFLQDIDRASKEAPVKFPLPQIISANEMAWKEDEEFGRQMLAGINPVVIRSLEKFPIVGQDGRPSAIKASHIDGELDDLNLDRAMLQRRMFVLDHHDYLMPFLSRINKKGVCAYASRTVLYLRDDATLKPVAIELSLPDDKVGEKKSRLFHPATNKVREKKSRVFHPGYLPFTTDFAVVNDYAHHQLIMPGAHHLFLPGGYSPFTTNFGDVNDYAHHQLIMPGDKVGEEKSRVFLPAAQGIEAALWQLAKAHVAANDSAHHQLISHWLNTHAVVEPFIIATRRQLSAMHPIHRLLEPHFKDTMHINALARSIIINGGGLLEKTLFPGKLSMEITSFFYKNWRFDEQGLPADLLKRRMAMEDSSHPSGVRLIFEDYPYGVDGLDIWTTILTWVVDYCKIFYPNDDTVKSDVELQAWWSEIRTVGHGDIRKGWYDIDSITNLTKSLTTFIWIASALHASVNFGQYAYGGYPPNRPSLCRMFVPKEGTMNNAEFLQGPDEDFLIMLPERFEMTLGVALVEILSKHASDEMYLGQRGLLFEWTDNEQVVKRFKKFQEDLKEVEKKITERNNDPQFKNRWGPAKIKYTLMYPDTSNVEFKGGLTGKGIPNSVSI